MNLNKEIFIVKRYYLNLYGILHYFFINKYSITHLNKRNDLKMDKNKFICYSKYIIKNVRE